MCLTGVFLKLDRIVGAVVDVASSAMTVLRLSPLPLLPTDPLVVQPIPTVCVPAGTPVTMPDTTRFAVAVELAPADKTMAAFGTGWVSSSRYAPTFALQEPPAVQLTKNPLMFIMTRRFVVLVVVTVASWKQQKAPLSPVDPGDTPPAVGPGGPWIPWTP
jgi:hypothetical protein